MLPTPFHCSTVPIRNVRAKTQDINPFLPNLNISIYKSFTF